MSGDEDSFIVIDETPSMFQFSMLDTQNNQFAIDNSSIFESTQSNGFQLENNKPNHDSHIKHLNDTSGGSASLQSIENALISASKPIPSIKEQSLKESNVRTSPKTTLAQSFLMGDINSDTIKNCIFPSPGNLPSDVEKWRTLIQERNDLKDALQRTNATMRQQYTMVNDWQNSVKDLKDNHEKELIKFRTINDEGKVAELQHLAELSRKMRNDIKDEQMLDAKLKNEQLEKQVQSLKSELANTIAMNVETDEAYRESVQKSEKLQVELIAIQKLFKNASAEIATLKAQNECLRRELEHTKLKVIECRDNANIIQTQCDIYRNDFELERKQREEMVFERDQLLADVRMLKKRNQALIDEASSYYDEASISSLSSIVPNNSIEDNNESQFVCPLCSQMYKSLNELESHVQSCLEKNG